MAPESPSSALTFHGQFGKGVLGEAARPEEEGSVCPYPPATCCCLRDLRSRRCTPRPPPASPRAQPPCTPSPAFSVEGVASPSPEPFELPPGHSPRLQSTCSRRPCDLRSQGASRSMGIPMLLVVCTPEKLVPLCWCLGLVDRSGHSVA